MKKIDKTKMDYDFLLDYVVNHCEQLTEITEENKKYFKYVTFYGYDWDGSLNMSPQYISEYKMEENILYYKDKNDSNVYYRLEYQEELTSPRRKIKEKNYIEIFYVDCRKDSLYGGRENIFLGCKTVVKGKKYTDKRDKNGECDKVFSMIYNYLDYLKLNEKLNNQKTIIKRMKI